MMNNKLDHRLPTFYYLDSDPEQPLSVALKVINFHGLFIHRNIFS